MPKRVSNRGRGARRAGGFTLLEALFAASVLAVVVAAVTQSIVAGQMQTYDAMHSARAVALTEAMMEEILVLPYDDPEGGVVIGPDAGETTRQQFDDIDDYHGWSASPPQTRDGDPIPAFPGWSRRVAVEWVEHDDPTVPTGAAGPTKRIRVVVERPGGEWHQRLARRSESWSAGG